MSRVTRCWAASCLASSIGTFDTGLFDISAENNQCQKYIIITSMCPQITLCPHLVLDRTWPRSQLSCFHNTIQQSPLTLLRRRRSSGT
jgi:hypothetical protein